jgi:hypothetical protein
MRHDFELFLTFVVTRIEPLYKDDLYSGDKIILEKWREICKHIEKHINTSWATTAIYRYLMYELEGLLREGDDIQPIIRTHLEEYIWQYLNNGK